MNEPAWESRLEKLLHKLERAPVMGNFHPLIPLCLPMDVDVLSNPLQLIAEMDARHPHHNRPVLITNCDPSFHSRFQSFDFEELPPSELINQFLSERLQVARKILLTHLHISDQIIRDVIQYRYESVILLLVDGLSYDDTKDWAERPQPCFIDGPTITYSLNGESNIDPKVGFPGIVGIPSLARRLVDVGLPRSYGFSYWDSSNNQVAANMFQGISLARVSSISEAINAVESLNLKGTYVQIVREGLDGLAHHRREVSTTEIQATIAKIHDDLHRLISLLTHRGLRGAIYLTADHGILWKYQHIHRFRIIENTSARHSRYSFSPLSESDKTVSFQLESGTCYACTYPYINMPIRANDSGIHGGVSYWESIVPFVCVEVNK